MEFIDICKEIDAMHAAGSQLSIIGLPKNEPPDVVERVARALT